MKLSVIAEGQEGVTWEHWLALADACERLGIGALYSSDHFLPVSDPHRGALDMWGCICALAARTSTLRLGTNVTPVTFRHPIALAKIVSTADQISGGRVDLGLGIGSMEHEHRTLGIPFGSASERFDQLEEEIEILQGVWSADDFSFAGAHFQVSGATVNPKPVNGTVPITVGGVGKPRSISLAARSAARYNLPHPTPELARECRRALNRACEEVSRDPATLPLSVMCSCAFGETAEQARLRGDQLIERLPILEQFGDRWIGGVLSEATEQLLALGEAGVEEILLQVGHDDLAVVELIGRELIPAVSGGSRTRLATGGAT
jgi:alkanesulfonate monooxygenase SsuD/methylene tetrahydromethanopterin reductase-like flavin-dependent oxidoreductase (luciferase family)